MQIYVLCDIYLQFNWANILGSLVISIFYPEIIFNKQESLRERDDIIQQQHADIADLEDKLNSRPWVLSNEEVELTDVKIGGGAYGEVRLAVFRGSEVAAKCLHELIVSEYNLEVFTREMEISSRVHHPNIVQFIGATRVNKPILLYELMTTSLHQELQKGKPLDQWS